MTDRGSRGPIVRLSIELLHVQPKVRRVVELPSRIRLDEVHRLIIAIMPWAGGHLHQYRFGEQRWGTLVDSDHDDFGIVIHDERTTTLATLLDKAGSEPITYLYDFGDGWEHTIVLETILDPSPDTTYPRLIQAEGTCPPDDVGGPVGYRALLAALIDKRLPDYGIDIVAAHREFQPGYVDVDAIEARLAELARRWAASSG